ncbi:putative ribonuclease H-like domain-containing protein [Tanacetum coccineum]
MFSGCSRHMTGNMSYLSDFKEFDGGYVTFGGKKKSKGSKITCKRTLKSGKLDFKDVYFVKELQFNLFSVSQMCDKKNSVLFTDTGCFVMFLDFKLVDESQATLDESMLWHRRLGHVNFKTINKLVKDNLVRVYPQNVLKMTKLVLLALRESNTKPHKGIKREFSIARTPQQNGVAKRRNRTLIKATRTMLADSNLHTTFCGLKQLIQEGIDCDEVFAPAARIEAIRMFLAYALFKDFVVYKMDVKSAFLYGKIKEEVYVCQPLGFEDPEFPDRVYKVEKALYGLHQALRAWYETLSTI